MSSSDVALLKEVESLMPDSITKPRFVESDKDDIHVQLQHLSQRLSKTSADPAVRRAATAVLEELRCYFGEERSQNARTVFAGHFARFVSDLVEKENVREGWHWWMEFLLKIEDARPFTRSNWAHASTFEQVLSRCRLKLLDLRLEDAPQLRLREALREVHNSARHAADDLLEVLYIGLRTKPATERFSYLDLCECMKAGLCGSKAFGNLEDQIIFHILDMEKSHSVDLLAGCFLPECAQEEFPEFPEDGARSAAGVAARRHVQELLQELQDPVRDRSGGSTTGILDGCVQVLGIQAWTAFWELHGLYCLLSALLKRLEICFAAVQDYASFICFLPVHQAALLDSEHLLPHLQERVAEKAKLLMGTYEVLPRASAPPKRALFLEKCRSLLHQLSEMANPCRMATDALRHVTPQATLQDFYLWRETDQRWKQFARLQLAARALLKPKELEALKVKAISRHLSDGPADPNACAASRRLSIRDIKEPSCNGCDGSSGHADEMPTNEGTSLRCFVDEDTRLHQAVCKLVLVGQIGQNAWHGALQTATMVKDKTKHLFPTEKAHELAPASCAKVSELVDVFCKITGVGEDEPTMASQRDFQDMEWIVLDCHGQQIDTV